MKTPLGDARVWLGVALIVLASPLPAQEPAPEVAPTAPTEATVYVDTVTPLLEREPFDIIILDEENKSFQAEVRTLELPRPRLPADQRKGKLQFRFLNDDAFLYEVEWTHLVDVKYFENMLFEQAQRLLAEAQQIAADAQQNKVSPDFEKMGKLLDESYRYFTRMKLEYPKYPGLEAAIDEFLYQDAGTLYRAERFAESLSVMEQLHERNNNFRGGQLKTVMGRLVSQIVRNYVDKSDYRSARIVLDRLAEKYGADQPTTISTWRTQLDQLAGVKLEEARTQLQQESFREAIALVRQALDISPTVPGGAALEQTLATTYPQIIVGVMQPALTFDSGRLDNWSARRTGRLVHRSLVEFQGAGSTGGEYELPGGLIERSPDGRTMTFRLQQFSQDQSNPIGNGYDLAQRLLELASPRSTDYLPAWSSLVTGITVENVLKVDVSLRRSHVLPQALLRVPVASMAEPSSGQVLDGTGAFRVESQEDSETRFALKGFTPGSRLAELIERRFDNAQSAINALLRGQIDVIDRLFPSDAVRLNARLGRDSQLVLQQYALPTVHMLIPQSDHPFLANANFRRALVFGIDRERILNEVLLGGATVPGCRILTGPFPAGVDQIDPLGYAYDHTLSVWTWQPRLAKLLTIIAEKELAVKAESLEEEPPKLTPLVLACPATESARIACQTIATHLALIGIEVTVKELPPGASTDPDQTCDLLYAEIAIWEPIVDARRLLGTDGVCATDSPYIAQALRRLDESENWGAVRDQLVALHRAAHYEATVIPLWQTADFFVYNKRLRNLGERPIWLYQNIDQWRLGVETAQRSSVIAQ